MAKEKQTKLFFVLGLVVAVLAALGWVLTAVPAMTQDDSGEGSVGVTTVTQIIPMVVLKICLPCGPRAI